MRKITNEELGRPSAEEFAAMEKMPVTVVLDNVPLRPAVTFTKRL